MQSRIRPLALVLVLLAVVLPASAGKVSIDEHHDTYILTGLQTVNPVVGVLYLCEGALAPRSGTCGDAGLTWSDSVYFTSPGPNQMTIYYESDNSDGGSSPVDTGFGTFTPPPGSIFMSIGEGLNEGGFEHITYTPTDGQPGFAASDNLTFEITSDTPEPATCLLLSAGFLAAGLVRRRRR